MCFVSVSFPVNHSSAYICTSHEVMWYYAAKSNVWMLDLGTWLSMKATLWGCCFFGGWVGGGGHLCYVWSKNNLRLFVAAWTKTEGLNTRTCACMYMHSWQARAHTHAHTQAKNPPCIKMKEMIVVSIKNIKKEFSCCPITYAYTEFQVLALSSPYSCPHPATCSLFHQRTSRSHSSAGFFWCVVRLAQHCEVNALTNNLTTVIYPKTHLTD